MSDILQYIGKGKENAVSRESLCKLTGQCDRSNRREIELLKQQDHIPIINLGNGYYICDSKTDFERYERQERRRIFNELKTLSSMKTWFRDDI